jgi:hypothetical protein
MLSKMKFSKTDFGQDCSCPLFYSRLTVFGRFKLKEGFLSAANYGSGKTQDREISRR